MLMTSHRRRRRIPRRQWIMPIFVSVASWSLPSCSLAAAPSPRIEGMWVWEPEYITNSVERDKLLAFCDRQGFNRLLVQIPWKKGSVKPQIDHAKAFATLISKASAQHIAVEALDGAPDMGDKANWPTTLAMVDAVIGFNRSVPPSSRFAGLHWDIEPYGRPEWKVTATRIPIELDYLNLLSMTKKKLEASGSKMTLSVDIPMWYDERINPDDTVVVDFNGQTKNLHQHIQDICDYVGIMSYRQHGTGNSNSAFAKVANELAYAEKIGKYICPAFETTNTVDEPTITFYGMSADRLQIERHDLEAAEKGSPAFGGMFLHCYPAVASVLEPGVPTK